MLSERTHQFIERMGLVMERLGVSRTFGRLFALLMVAERPLSLAEMSELLHVSKASVSTNARLCEQLGLAQQVSVRGDRRDYYEVQPGCFECLTARRIATIQQMSRLAEEGLAAVGEQPSPARSRLEEMRDFYGFIGREVEQLLTRWKEVQA